MKISVVDIETAARRMHDAECNCDVIDLTPDQCWNTTPVNEKHRIAIEEHREAFRESIRRFLGYIQKEG